MVKEFVAELVLDARARLGEGPSWDPDADRLVWVDILEGRVHLFGPETGRDRQFEVGQPVGVAVRRARGGLVLAAQSGFLFLDPDTGSLTPVAEVEADLVTNRMNDGKCDSRGRFWAGTMPFDGERPVGALYRLGTNLEVDKVVDGVTISNGIGWCRRDATMYYVDTRVRRVDAFDYDPETGAIENRRPVVHVPPELGDPDGLTVDAEGYLWLALWGGSAVHRYAPDGTHDAVVRLPTSQVTSCTFGGRGLDELYITSASDGLSPAELEAQPTAGGLFRARPGVQGVLDHAFAG